MGSYNDDDETQPFDFPSSPILGDYTLPGKKTAPFEDELETQVMNFEDESQNPFEDGLETQVMNFADETQVLNEVGLETQVMNVPGERQFPVEVVFEHMNLANETQVLDDFVCLNNMDTQLLDESNDEKLDKRDGEESDKTEMVYDTDELSDNDSVKKVGCSSADQENTTISKQDDKENRADLEALFFKQMSQDSGVKMDFTSVRTASLRASGLAARSKARCKGNGELCSSETLSGRLKEVHAYEDNNSTGATGSLVRDVVTYGAVEDEHCKGVRDESKGKNGNSAARRLFMDIDKLYDNEEPNDNYSNDADGVDLLQCSQIAGLSYVDSQEPGDLSQANALDFVENFLKSNDMDFGKEVSIIGSNVQKSKPVSSIKGTQSLAKKSRLKSIADETGIYDWDDNCEDEGGGEFFSRQKTAFFDEDFRSGSKGRNAKKTAKKAMVVEVRKNLAKELDEQLNVDDSIDGKEATCSKNNLQDELNVGPDTQMAAEAMEVLCLGLDVTDTNGLTKDTRKSSTAGKEDENLPKKYSLRKRSAGSSSCEDLPIKAKQVKKSAKNKSNDLSITSSKQTKTVRKQHKDLDTFSPIASRTRRHTGARQTVAGNITCDATMGTLSYKKGRQSDRKKSDNGLVPINQLSGTETKQKPRKISDGSNVNPQSFSPDHNITRKKRSSLRAGTVFLSSDREHKRRLCNGSGEKEEVAEGSLKCKVRDDIRIHAQLSGGTSNLDVSPVERSQLSVSTTITPASCTSSAIAASPICMGDEYVKQSCRKNLANEIDRLVSNRPELTSTTNESRRRRDMANVRVLFSHHLDDDTIKNQKKILAKLGASVAASIREATHFVTDKFVRTRNMLEAIAFGKPVVTHLWLESCGQASCCIDEKSYILRDAKKEKDFGFSLVASLAQACQRPLLQGLRVWITPNTKPGLEILSSLVKAVHGLPVKRIGRSVLKDDNIPDDLLALSCEEDYAICQPFLEKGGAIYSSELLLNGIVTQKLEYERHLLFDNHVKKTCSARRQFSASPCFD